MSYYENMYSAAVELADSDADFRLAHSPATYFSPGTHHLNGPLQIALGETVEFLAERGPDAADLRSLAVNVYPTEGVDKHDNGQLISGPIEFEGQVHYPVIRIGVPNKQVRKGRLNNTMRHELGHVLQESDRDSLNRMPHAKLITGAVGILVGAVLVKHGIDAPADDLAQIGGFAGAAIGCASLYPDPLLYALDPEEIGANFFAWRNRDFNPISLTE